MNKSQLCNDLDSLFLCATTNIIAYNGKNLVAPGSLNSSSYDQIPRDVFVFDVASSTWSKVVRPP